MSATATYYREVAAHRDTLAGSAAMTSFARVFRIRQLCASIEAHSEARDRLYTKAAALALDEADDARCTKAERAIEDGRRELRELVPEATGVDFERLMGVLS